MDGLVLQGGYVYWTSTDKQSIGRRPLSTFGGNFEAEPTCEPEYFKLEGTPAGLTTDGERLYWSVNGEAPSNPGNDLYRFDADSGRLTDLAPDPAGNGAEVVGMLGASDDGSYVYFAANGVLAEGASPGDCSYTEGGGSCNLYLDHEGQISFIASLKNNDADDWREKANTSHDLSDQPKTARVSADGHTLLFRSQRKADRLREQGTPELYRYRARTRRSSASPATRPVCRAKVGTFTDRGLASIFTLRTIDPAAVLPATSPPTASASSSRAPTAPRRRHQRRSRLPTPKNSPAPLCQDVYEWVATGKGSCESEAQNGGCVYLISTGDGTEPAYFIDAARRAKTSSSSPTGRWRARQTPSSTSTTPAQAAASPPSTHRRRRTSAKGKPAGTARPPRPRAARRRHRSSRAPATPSPVTRAKSPRRRSTSDTTSTSDTRRPTGGRSDEQVKDNEKAAPLPARRPALPGHLAGAAKRRFGGGAEIRALSIFTFPSSFSSGAAGNATEGPAYRVVATNTGDSSTTAPYTITTTLPADVSPVESKVPGKAGSNTLSCAVNGQEIICTGSEPLGTHGAVKGSGEAEVIIPVDVATGTAGKGVISEASVEGGGAPPAKAKTKTAVGLPAWALSGTSVPTNVPARRYRHALRLRGQRRCRGQRRHVDDHRHPARRTGANRGDRQR